MESDNNEKYGILMAQYKSLRTKNPEEANRYLEAAQKVLSMGEVDHDTVLGSAYE